MHEFLKIRGNKFHMKNNAWNFRFFNLINLFLCTIHARNASSTRRNEKFPYKIYKSCHLLLHLFALKLFQELFIILNFIHFWAHLYWYEGWKIRTMQLRFHNSAVASATQYNMWCDMSTRASRWKNITYILHVNIFVTQCAFDVETFVAKYLPSFLFSDEEISCMWL